MEKPNILIFMTDQQRADTVPPYGRAKMPNVERLAAEGVVFSQAYCPSPHCCPSRATFFSGLYPSGHGVWNNVSVGNALSRGPFRDVRLWSEDLRDAGYELYFSGKWHVSAIEEPSDRGWKTAKNAPAAEPALRDVPNVPPHRKDWDAYTKSRPQQQRTDVVERGRIERQGYPDFHLYGEHPSPFNDRQVVDDALRYQRERKPADKPWCHYVGTLGPHDPYFVPPQYLQWYDPEQIELPPSFGDDLRDKPNLYRRVQDRFRQLSEQEQREALHHYLAFCSYQDALFGELVDLLEEQGQLDNTVIMFVSDHGDYAAEHGLWAKGLPCFRGAYHVPLIVRWPEGVKQPGRSVDRFVSLADIGPTILDMANIAYSMDGTLSEGRRFAGASLLPFLAGEQPRQWREEIYTQSNGNELYGIQRSVMTSDWKFVYNGFDYDELYDLRHDPHEMHNVAQRPEYRDVIRELSRKLWTFAADNGDVCVNPYIMTGLASYGPGIMTE